MNAVFIGEHVACTANRGILNSHIYVTEKIEISDITDVWI